MSGSVSIDLPVLVGLSGFKLPSGVQKRLATLLDQQDSGKALTAAKRREAEGLVELSEFLSLLKLRARRCA
jgi:hypothetical protein